MHREKNWDPLPTSTPSPSSPHPNVGKDQPESLSGALPPKQQAASRAMKQNASSNPQLHKGIQLPGPAPPPGPSGPFHFDSQCVPVIACLPREVGLEGRDLAVKAAKGPTFC